MGHLFLGGHLGLDGLDHGREIVCESGLFGIDLRNRLAQRLGELLVLEEERRLADGKNAMQRDLWREMRQRLDGLAAPLLAQIGGAVSNEIHLGLGNDHALVHVLKTVLFRELGQLARVELAVAEEAHDAVRERGAQILRVRKMHIVDLAACLVVCKNQRLEPIDVRALVKDAQVLGLGQVSEMRLIVRRKHVRRVNADNRAHNCIADAHQQHLGALASLLNTELLVLFPALERIAVNRRHRAVRHPERLAHRPQRLLQQRRQIVRLDRVWVHTVVQTRDDRIHSSALLAERLQERILLHQRLNRRRKTLDIALGLHQSGLVVLLLFGRQAGRAAVRAVVVVVRRR
eukprot:comp13325_c0_seq1/m.18297 comp13325_c0_seq1/g.18297  ORF comp13325_c0_seq1/g.18297 comp13325_c0_seq1/m.18297 type:complete len:346 (+) comp13325_c0_seq1:373-1410(+)